MWTIPVKIYSFLVILTLVLSAALSPHSAAQSPTDEKLDPKIYDSYLGPYRLASGRLVVIGRSQRRLYYYEPDTGLTRGLDRSPDPRMKETWLAGPTFLVFTPPQFQITFIKNRAKVTGFKLTAGVRDQEAKKDRALSGRESDLSKR